MKDDWGDKYRDESIPDDLVLFFSNLKQLSAFEENMGKAFTFIAANRKHAAIMNRKRRIFFVIRNLLTGRCIF